MTKSAKITVRGNRAIVQAIVAQMREFLEISHISKPQRLAGLRWNATNDEIQINLRAIVMEVPQDDEPGAA